MDNSDLYYTNLDLNTRHFLIFDLEDDPDIRQKQNTTGYFQWPDIYNQFLEKNGSALFSSQQNPTDAPKIIPPANAAEILFTIYNSLYDENAMTLNDYKQKFAASLIEQGQISNVYDLNDINLNDINLDEIDLEVRQKTADKLGKTYQNKGMTINQRDLLGRVKENEIDRVIDFTCRLLCEQKGPAVKVRVRDILDHAVSTDELKTMNRNLCLAYDLSKKRCEDFINNKDKNQHVPHPLWFIQTVQSLKPFLKNQQTRWITKSFWKILLFIGNLTSITMRKTMTKATFFHF